MVLTEVGSQGRAELCRYSSRRTERVVEGPLIRVPWALVRHTLRGYLNFATAAGAMAIHGHGGSVVVTVTRGAGDAWAHCY